MQQKVIIVRNIILNPTNAVTQMETRSKQEHNVVPFYDGNCVPKQSTPNT